MTRGHALAIYLALNTVILLWVAWDARRRGRSAILAVLLVTLVPWPVGLIVWLIARPPIRRDDVRDRGSKRLPEWTIREEP